MEEAVGLVWSEWAAVLGGLVTPPISRGVKVLSELISSPTAQSLLALPGSYLRT